MRQGCDKRGVTGIERIPKNSIYIIKYTEIIRELLRKEQWVKYHIINGWLLKHAIKIHA
jgi:hypothetical protein